MRAHWRGDHSWIGPALGHRAVALDDYAPAFRAERHHDEEAVLIRVIAGLIDRRIPAQREIAENEMKGVIGAVKARAHLAAHEAVLAVAAYHVGALNQGKGRGG